MVCRHTTCFVQFFARCRYQPAWRPDHGQVFEDVFAAGSKKLPYDDSGNRKSVSRWMEANDVAARLLKITGRSPASILPLQLAAVRATEQGLEPLEQPYPGGYGCGVGFALVGAFRYIPKTSAHDAV